MHLHSAKIFQVRKFVQREGQKIPNYRQIYPGILLTGNFNDKINYELLIDYFFEADTKNNILEVVLENLERQIEQISLRCENKTGIDLSVLGSKRTIKSHKCKYCGKIFYKAQALGGHISKIHSKTKRETNQALNKPRKTKIIEKKQYNIVTIIQNTPNETKQEYIPNLSK